VDAKHGTRTLVTLIPIKKLCPSQSNLPPHPLNSHSHSPHPPSCVQQLSASRAITMNTFEFYSNADDVQDGVASAPWPDSPWAMGYTSVPQSTHPDLISIPGHLSNVGPYIPDLNATNYAAFTLTPTTEMGMFTNLPTTQVDYTYQVSNQQV
jgi:hypothetical protein